jgi:hypothetical protein
MPSTNLPKGTNPGMQTLETEAFPDGRRTTYWLIFSRSPDRPEPLTVGTFPHEALAVFTFEEEARFFLTVQGLTELWTAKEISVIDLVSILLDTLPNHVALDPLPGPFGDKMVGMLSVSRERFLRDLVRKRRPVAALIFVDRGDEKKGA